jgi:hypothetical protein
MPSSQELPPLCMPTMDVRWDAWPILTQSEQFHTIEQQARAWGLSSGGLRGCSTHFVCDPFLKHNHEDMAERAT